MPPANLASAGSVTAIALVGLLVLAVTCTLYFARHLLIPVIAAVLAGYLLKPVTRLLRRLGLPAMAGTILVFAVFVGTLSGGLYLLTPPAAHWVQNLPTNLDKAERRLRNVIRSVGAVREAVDEVAAVSTPKAPGEPDVVTVAPPSLSARILDGARSFFVGGGVAAFLLFFLLASGETFLRRTVSMLPTLSQKKRLVRISHGIERDLSRYMITTSLINAGLGITVGVVIALIGVPNPVLWGVAVALLNFVPYIGAIVGVLVIGLVAIVSIESTGRALLAPAAYVLLNVLEAYVITPHIMGRRFSLNPVAVFGAVAFWGWLWGIPGALLAVPILTASSIVCANIDRLRPIAVFLRA
ncbi:MAG: AI-2E family transporter [Gemmatimonadetes bacterium]|nr:AI-2E family transporter [Gemmatimonadota bacterium]